MKGTKDISHGELPTPPRGCQWTVPTIIEPPPCQLHYPAGNAMLRTLLGRARIEIEKLKSARAVAAE
jgi:hypothetical protein